jgi:hypothetical protein
MVEEFASRDHQASITEAGNSFTGLTIGGLVIGVQVPDRDGPDSRSGRIKIRVWADGNLLVSSWHRCRIDAAFDPDTGISGANTLYFAARREFAVGDWFDEDCVLSQQVVDLSLVLRSAPIAREQRAFATSDVVCASQTRKKGVKFDVCLSGVNLASVFVREKHREADPAGATCRCRRAYHDFPTWSARSQDHTKPNAARWSAQTQGTR